MANWQNSAVMISVQPSCISLSKSVPENWAVEKCAFTLRVYLLFQISHCFFTETKSNSQAVLPLTLRAWMFTRHNRCSDCHLISVVSLIMSYYLLHTLLALYPILGKVKPVCSRLYRQHSYLILLITITSVILALKRRRSNMSKPVQSKSDK